jgi:hypothetical protein
MVSSFISAPQLKKVKFLKRNSDLQELTKKISISSHQVKAKVSPFGPMGPQTWERMAEKDEGRVQVKEVESKGSG